MIPKVSIVMCAFNEELYVLESIESVLQSSLENFELIVINDASADRTLEIVEKLAAKDPRIKIYSNLSNLGIAESSNLGFSIAKGEFIAIMDADDVTLPERFELQVSLLEGNPNIGVIGASMYTFSGIDQKEIRQARCQKIRQSLVKENTIHNPTAMFRRQLLQDGKFKCKKKYRFAHDYEFWTQLSVQTEFANISKPLLIYRDNKNSRNSNSSKAPLRREYEVFLIRFRHLIRLVRSDYFKPVHFRYFLASILKGTFPAIFRILKFEVRKFLTNQ